MDRKGIIISVTAIALMLLGIGIALGHLFPGEGTRRGRSVDGIPSRFEILEAVPNDAALVFCFDGSRSSVRHLSDTSGFLRAFIAPDGSRSLERFIEEMSSREFVVSLHNSGALVPLYVARCQHADTSKLSPVLSLAGEAGLKARFVPEKELLLASRSETLVSTSARHLDGGFSILGTKGLPEALSMAGDYPLALVNHLGARKLIQTYMAPSFRRFADQFSHFAHWSVMSLGTLGGDSFRLEGRSYFTDDANLYLNVLKAGTSARDAAEFQEILPPETAYAVSLGFDADTYFAQRRHFLDARGRLDAYKAENQSKKDSLGRTPEQVAAALGINAVVVAGLGSGETTSDVLLFHSQKKFPGKGEIVPYMTPGLSALVFGEIFSVPEESFTMDMGQWRAIGPKSALEALLTPGKHLKDWLHSAGRSLPGDSPFVLYLSAVYPGMPDRVFRSPLSPLMKEIQGQVPVIASASGDSFRLEASRVMSVKGFGTVSASGTPSVEVPAGPFEVINSTTGRINTFYQNEQLSLCLKDENGKGVWGVPFKTPLCGRVCNIDYYGNGRIQFLFASASSLYLMDRLGRFVQGFPASLGKEVLLGPDVYDFTGEHAYRVMILHTDNTLEMYNLHGQKPEGWKTIQPDGSILALPQMVEFKDVKYWLVRTSAGDRVYPLLGGDRVSQSLENKIVKRQN